MLVNGLSRDKYDNKTDVKGVRDLCRAVHQLLEHFKPAQWSASIAEQLVNENAVVTSKDETLAKIIGSDSGAESLKSLAWVMFGNIDDGASITVEPLLDDDMVLDLSKSCAVIRVRFGVKVREVKTKGQHSEKEGHRGDFGELEKALAGAERVLQAEGAEALDKAVADVRGKSVRKLKLKKKKRDRSNLGKRKDARLARFIKAARYARGVGVAVLHLRLKT